jgi:hypothetical protein
MSEYQYYEFQAIDRPLDERAMAALRAITSRAQITPTSLVNVYHFGDFKGNPDRLVDQYFDAFLYLANWGTRRLMFRLPRPLFDLTAAQPYCVPESLKARANAEHVVLDFHSDSEDGWDDEGGEGWLASLIPLRADLLAGDLRCLYLAWLAGIQNDAVDGAEQEPPVPPGLGSLSAPLQRFADFLRLDPDLLEIAAVASAEAGPTHPPPEELAAWVKALPEVEKDNYLVRLMQGETPYLAGELLKRYRGEQARVTSSSAQGPPSAEARRTVGSLLEARDRQAEENRRREAARAAEEQARRAREQAEARARHLDSLAGRQPQLWRQVEAAIGTKQPKEYDRALSLLQDLQDLAKRAGDPEAFAARMRQLRQRHHSKWSLIRRLDQADLPQ